MNKIVKEHYPAGKLPEELRGSIAASASVRITIEEEQAESPSREQLKRLLDDARRHAEGVTLDEAVQRVRELRDEWGD